MHRAVASLYLIVGAAVAVPLAGALTPLTDSNINAAADLWNSNPTQAESTYGHISEWDTSHVTKMREVFAGVQGNTNPFNGDVSKWDTSAVTDMYGCFYFTRK